MRRGKEIKTLLERRAELWREIMKLYEELWEMKLKGVKT